MHILIFLANTTLVHCRDPFSRLATGRISRRGHVFVLNRPFLLLNLRCVPCLDFHLWWFCISSSYFEKGLSQTLLCLSPRRWIIIWPFLDLLFFFSICERIPLKTAQMMLLWLYFEVFPLKKLKCASFFLQILLVSGDFFCKENFGCLFKEFHPSLCVPLT